MRTDALHGPVVGLFALFLSSSVSAQSVQAPASYTADSAVYKLLSENEYFRVIEATWKPGQRDAWHSHAGVLTSYRLTDCQVRGYAPDGKTLERTVKAGSVGYNPVIASHSVENIGKTTCHMIIVERK